MTVRDLGASGAGPAHEGPLERGASCTTCADAARWMRVLEVDEARALALCVDEQGQPASVDIGIVGAVGPGDALLVHAGTALLREPG